MPAAGRQSAPPRATSVIVIGMAGSGKSTFVSRLTSHLGRLATEATPSAEAGAEGAPAHNFTERLVEEVFGLRSLIIADPVSGTPLLVPRGIAADAPG